MRSSGKVRYKNYFESVIFICISLYSSLTWRNYWPELVLHAYLSLSHRIIRVGRDLKDHLVPTPLPWAATSSTRPGCSELHPLSQFPLTYASSGVRNPSVSTFIHGLTHLGPGPSRASSFRSVTTISYKITDAAAQLLLYNNAFHIHPTQPFVCLMVSCF